MRLSPAQLDKIQRVCQQTFTNGASVWLFGSRLDDSARGGDVDLYVEAPPLTLIDELRCKIRLEEALQMPVDLIVRKPFDTSPIASIAKLQGHLL
jgi:predicted nucleotidyltransferase